MAAPVSPSSVSSPLSPGSAGSSVISSGNTEADGQHSLSFRVMRLARPDFKPSPVIKCEVRRAQEETLPKLEIEDSSIDWSSRIQLDHPSQACDLDGSLVLPQNFGNIQLGETFSCYISLGNSSEKAVNNISIRVELQTERQRRNIFENTSKPLQTLGPGQRYDFIIQHDVKELGSHTLVCSTVYTEGENERKYLPQWYKFNVTNPLVVRMKVRTVAENTFVEACLENATTSPLFLDIVKFEATPQFELLDLPICTTRTTLKHPSEIDKYLEKLVLLKEKGGSYNFVFCLKKLSLNAKDSNLGKLEIKWCKPMGDSGRLQTQQIQGVSPSSKKVTVNLVEIPSQVGIHSLFTAKLKVRNCTEQNIGPTFIIFSTYADGWIRSVGPSGKHVRELPVNVEIFVEFELIALRTGIFKVGPVIFFDELGRQIAESHCNYSVEVLRNRV